MRQAIKTKPLTAELFDVLESKKKRSRSEWWLIVFRHHFSDPGDHAL